MGEKRGTKSRLKGAKRHEEEPSNGTHTGTDVLDLTGRSSGDESSSESDSDASTDSSEEEEVEVEEEPQIKLQATHTIKPRAHDTPESLETPKKKVSFTFEENTTTPSSTPGGILKKNGEVPPGALAGAASAGVVADQFEGFFWFREGEKAPGKRFRPMVEAATRLLAQKDGLGGPEGAGFGDGGQRFSIYSTLNLYLRGLDSSSSQPAPEQIRVLATHAPQLSAYAREDITTAEASSNALDTRVVIQAVRFLAFLLFDQSVAESVDPEIVRWVVAQGLQKLADPGCSKSVLGGYLHLLSHHRVSRNVFTSETIELLYTELLANDKKSSTALTSEVLGIYQTTAAVHSQRALAHVTLWLPRVFCLAIDSRTGIRTQAFNVLSEFIMTAGPNSKALTARTSPLLNAPFSADIARQLGAQLPTWLNPKQSFAETILAAVVDCPVEDALYELWGLLMLLAPMDAESSIHAWPLLPQWLTVPGSLINQGKPPPLGLLKACRYVVHTHTRKHLVKYPAGLHALANRSGNTLMLCVQPLGRTTSQSVDQQCLSLFNQTLNTLLVSLDTNQITLKAHSVLWESYIRPTLSVMIGSSSLVSVGSASLACLLRVDTKPTKDREPVTSLSNRQLSASLSPRWVKANADKIVDLIRKIPLDSPEPNFDTVWSALAANLAHSASREIHPSSETAAFVVAACKLYRHISRLRGDTMDHATFYKSAFDVCGVLFATERVLDIDEERQTPAAHILASLIDSDTKSADNYISFIYSQLSTPTRRIQFTQSIASVVHGHPALFERILAQTKLDLSQANEPDTANLSPRHIYAILATANAPVDKDGWVTVLKLATDVIKKDTFLGSPQELLIEPLLQVVHHCLHHDVCLLGLDLVERKPKGISSPMFRSQNTDMPKDFVHLGHISCSLATKDIVSKVQKCLVTIPDHIMPTFLYRFAPLVMSCFETSSSEEQQRLMFDSIIRKMKQAPLSTNKTFQGLLVAEVFPQWIYNYQDSLKKLQVHLVGLWNELLGEEMSAELDQDTISILMSKYVSSRQEVWYQGARLEKVSPSKRRASKRGSKSSSSPKTRSSRRALEVKEETNESDLVSESISEPKQPSSEPMMMDPRVVEKLNSSKRRQLSGELSELMERETPRRKSRRLESTSPVKSSPLKLTFRAGQVDIPEVKIISEVGVSEVGVSEVARALDTQETIDLDETEEIDMGGIGTEVDDDTEVIDMAQNGAHHVTQMNHEEASCKVAETNHEVAETDHVVNHDTTQQCVDLATHIEHLIEHEIRPSSDQIEAIEARLIGALYKLNQQKRAFNA